MPTSESRGGRIRPQILRRLLASTPRHRRLTTLLAGLLAVLWIWLAIDPLDRQTWLLENALFVVFVAGLAACYRKPFLSELSYVLIFVFLCLHAVGAHFTYSLVPYDGWTSALTGYSISEVTGWQRNHYDRLVHLLFGALLVYPARELLVALARVRGFWSYMMPLLLMMSLSLLYELIEWAAALVFGGDLGIHYLGTQGDAWDGQRDMALATLGAVVTMAAAVAAHAMRKPEFAVEWRDSLRLDQRSSGPIEGRPRLG